MSAKTLLIVGTMSSSGKSLLTTALCRIFARKGVRVAPFKAQNMSNNAAICADGSQIGRAQALQAIAAGLEPDVNMSPVLIKPQSDAQSEIILMGKPWARLQAKSFYEKKTELWKHVTKAADSLRQQYDLVIMEGAGSPVELNLKQGDIVNMSMAKYMQAPTFIVGDIDRGGIYAQLLGTLWLMTREEQDLVKGLVVNKFRGDMALFQDGINLLEEKAGKPLLGIVPYLHDLDLPDEDTVSLMNQPLGEKQPNDLDIAILCLPRIANFDEFDALSREGGVHVHFVKSVEQLGPAPDAVIIPGSESVISDLVWMRKKGLASAVVHFAKQGGAVMGIGGGYPILGQTIADPNHIQSEIELVEGLGLLPSRTVFKDMETRSQTSGKMRADGQLPEWLSSLARTALNGFEIHCGQTESDTSWLEYTSRNGQNTSVMDGAVSKDGRILGCYLHGIFANDTFRHAWLTQLGWQSEKSASYDLEDAIDKLASHVEANLNMKRLEEIIWG